MNTHGIEVLDCEAQTGQREWLVVPAGECPDEATQRRIVSARFRVPHEPWGPSGGYVHPVDIRRSRRWVLFQQESGIRL